MSAEGAGGDRLVFPDGSKVTVLRSPGEPGTGPLVMRFSVPPGGMPTAPHVHLRQTETYRVEGGALEVMVGDRWSLLREGESATVPPATPHPSATDPARPSSS